METPGTATRSSSGPSTTNSVYQSYGGKQNFMASYGIKPTADGHVEARHIAEAMVSYDRQSSKK